MSPRHGRSFAGTGISTGYPSTTPDGLALGPDSPRADKPSPGTLSHPAGKILTFHSLLMPAFSLPHHTRPITRPLQQCRTLPYPTTKNVVVTVSVACLSPTTLSAHNHSTSKLLRTLSRVAASKPTSWLSTQLHILFHSAHT